MNGAQCPGCGAPEGACHLASCSVLAAKAQEAIAAGWMTVEEAHEAVLAATHDASGSPASAPLPEKEVEWALELIRQWLPLLGPEHRQAIAKLAVGLDEESTRDLHLFYGRLWVTVSTQWVGVDGSVKPGSPQGGSSLRVLLRPATRD